MTDQSAVERGCVKRNVKIKSRPFLRNKSSDLSHKNEVYLNNVMLQYSSNKNGKNLRRTQCQNDKDNIQSERKFKGFVRNYSLYD